MSQIKNFKKKANLSIAICNANTDIEILQYMIRVKQFNIDNAEDMVKKLVRENKQEIAKYEDEISTRKEQLALYEQEWKALEDTAKDATS